MERHNHLKDRMHKQKKAGSLIQRKTGNNPGENIYDGFNTFLSSIGNQRILRLLGGGILQTKMNISRPGDFFEQQADHIASQIVNNSRQINAIGSGINIIQAANAAGGVVSEKSENHILNLKGRGIPLSNSVKSFFEPHFGVDLGNVRIHNNCNSNKLASSLNARAFTHGTDIVFNKGEYQPHTRQGKELIAHELTHVIQQGKVVQRDVIQREEWEKINNNAVYNQDAILYTVKENETLSDIATNHFQYELMTLNLSQLEKIEYIAHAMNAVLIMNKISSASHIQPGQNILLPNIIPIIHSKSEFGAEANVLGSWKSHTIGGVEINELIYALSETQWRDLMKKGKLDNLAGFRKYAQGFIKLATDDSIASTNDSTMEGFSFYRKPNIFEILALLKALYSPDVDLPNNLLEKNVLAFEVINGFAEFIRKYQYLIVEFEASKYRNIPPQASRQLPNILDDASIKALAEQSSGFGYAFDIRDAMIASAYDSFSKGMLMVLIGDPCNFPADISKSDLLIREEQMEMGKSMIRNSTKIIRFCFEQQDKEIAMQQAVLESIINVSLMAIPIPKAGKFLTDYARDLIRRTVITALKECIPPAVCAGKSYRERMLEYQSKIDEILRHWDEGLDIMSSSVASAVRAEMAFYK